MCDGRLLNVDPQTSGCSSGQTSRLRRTSRDVDEAERSRRLASASAGLRAYINLMLYLTLHICCRRLYQGWKMASKKPRFF